MAVDPPGTTPAGGPPAPPPPPPAPKKGKAPPSVEARAADLFKKFGGWKKHWGNVKNAAYRWKVDPVELLALFIFENGKADPNAKSSAGALGLAQIHDTAVNKNLNPVQYDTFIQEWAGGDPRITDQMKRDPAFAIQYAAWRMAGSRGKYATLDDWYRSPGYNPNFTGDKRGPGPSIYVGRYQPTVPQTPAQAAGSDLDKAGAKAGLTASWAVRGKDGKVKFIRSPEPPRNVITRWRRPVTEEAFLEAESALLGEFYSYIGRPPRPEEVAGFLQKGWSDYALRYSLSKTPEFKRGELYKSRAGDVIQYARNYFGENWKTDDEFVRKAVVGNWDEGTLVKNLRERKEYLRGPKFKRDEASLMAAHQQIMGQPDPETRVAIQEAALGGWDADMYAAYLRGEKEYTAGPEYQTKMLGFADALGLITGAVPSLVPGKPPVNPNPQTQAPIPDSPRIKGKPVVNTGPSYKIGVAGLGR